MNQHHWIELNEPWWLALLLLLPVIWWLGRSNLPRQRSLWTTLIRFSLLLIGILSLCGVTLWLSIDRPYVIFAVDVSSSIGENAMQFSNTYLDNVDSIRAGVPVSYLTFASTPGAVAPTWLAARSEAAVARNKQGTNLETALKSALAAVPPGYSPRVVMLTDGLETIGNLRSAARNSAARIYTVPLPGREEPQVQLARVEAPSQAREGEPFAIDITVASTCEDSGQLDVFCRGIKSPSASMPLKVKPGITRLRRQLIWNEAGMVEVVARLRGFAKDRDHQDDEGRALVNISGKPRVLLIEGGPQPKDLTPLEEALRSQNFMADPPAGPEAIPDSLAGLQSYDLVILSDVPATHPALGRNKLDLLKRYVSDWGGGLIVAGGEQSFGPGGYARSPLDELLPVRCDLRDARERPTLALLLIIDISGSMRQDGKLDAAREAALAAAGTINPSDQVGLIVFNTKPRWVSELRPASANSGQLAESLRGLEAEGGTAIYPALEEGIKYLNDLGASARFKHIILLSDGADDPKSNTQTEYNELMERAMSQRIVVSTVGVGDADQPFLKNLSARTNGKSYYTNDPRDLPRFVLKTTMEVGKRSLREGSFAATPVREWSAMAGIDFAAAPPLKGFIITSPKASAIHALQCAETGDPLLAWWRQGLGSCAAFTSDIKGRWSEEWVRDWPDFATFWSQLSRQVARVSEPQGTEVRFHQDGNTLDVDLDWIKPGGGYVNETLNDLLYLETTPGGAVAVDAKSDTIKMTQTRPGHYHASFPLSVNKPNYVIQLRLVTPQGERLQLTRGYAMGFDEELLLKPADDVLLREVAEISGGTYNPAVMDIFANSPSVAQQRFPMNFVLLPLILLLLLVEVALRRFPSRSFVPEVAA